MANVDGTGSFSAASPSLASESVTSGGGVTWSPDEEPVLGWASDAEAISSWVSDEEPVLSWTADI